MLLDISLACNPVSKFSLVGKSSAKVLRPGGMKFHSLFSYLRFTVEIQE